MAEKSTSDSPKQPETITEMVPRAFARSAPLDVSTQVANGFVMELTPAKRKELAAETKKLREFLFAAEH